MTETARMLVGGLKGGVGKTTITLNLAAVATAAGRRVLVVELDPQANAATTVTGLFSDEIERTIADVLVGYSEGGDPAALVAETVLSVQDPKLNITDYARESWGALDVLPANAEVAGLNLEPRHYRDLARILDRVDGYDLVLMDSAPGISRLTTLGAYAARGPRRGSGRGGSVISITEPAANSVAGVRQLITKMVTPVQQHHPELSLAGVIANKVDPRRSEDRLRLDELREQLGDLFCRAWLPDRPAVARGAEGAGLPIRAMSGVGAALLGDLYSKVYRYLISEVQ